MIFDSLKLKKATQQGGKCSCGYLVKDHVQAAGRETRRTGFYPEKMADVIQDAVTKSFLLQASVILVWKYSNMEIQFGNH